MSSTHTAPSIPPMSGGSWHQGTATGLVAPILERYPAVHRQQLPALIELARQVERVHAGEAACPSGLAAHLCAMAQELEAHMQKEEQVLFPLLARGHGALVRGAITVMRMEDEEHGHQLRRLVGVAHDLTPPANACTSWRALYAALHAFRNDLLAHIHLENDILFARTAPAQDH